jgi:hypothetical protein
VAAAAISAILASASSPDPQPGASHSLSAANQSPSPAKPPAKSPGRQGTVTPAAPSTAAVRTPPPLISSYEVELKIKYGIPSLRVEAESPTYSWQGQDLYYASSTLRLVSMDYGGLAPLSTAPSYAACAATQYQYNSWIQVNPLQTRSFCFRDKEGTIMAGIEIVSPLPDFNSAAQSGYPLHLKITVWPSP